MEVLKRCRDGDNDGDYDDGDNDDDDDDGDDYDDDGEALRGLIFG